MREEIMNHPGFIAFRASEEFKGKDVPEKITVQEEGKLNPIEVDTTE